MENQQIIENFYAAFAKGDAETMVGFYNDAIEFHDPAFGLLKGEDVQNMWRMLIERSKGGINITADNIKATDKFGSAHWVAKYVYKQTGRGVVNDINASFEFKDGKIIKHTDVFDLWKWSQQALGWKGYLLGWSSFMRNKIQGQTHLLLENYKARRM